MFALIDCNNFYASCERLFRPDLRNTPIVVLSNNDGCVIARSNEAKQLGIPMGAPYFEFKGLCHKHKIQVFSSNYTLYGDISARVMSVIQDEWPEVEVYSIDEAFLDLKDMPPTLRRIFCEQLQKKILQHTGIPTSIGIGLTKTRAKLANFIAKKALKIPVVHLEEINPDEWLNRIQVEDVWGVGGRLSQQLKALNIHTAFALAHANPAFIKKKFSVVLQRTVYELQGRSCLTLEEVTPKQSIVSSKSFGSLQTHLSALEEAISSHVARAWEKLRSQDSTTQYLSVFVRSNHFRPDLKQYANHIGFKLIHPSDDLFFLTLHAKICLRAIYKEGIAYKKVGVMLDGLMPKKHVQLDLFSIEKETDKTDIEQKMQAIEAINHKFGRGTVKLAAEGYSKPWAMRAELKSRAYTTNWLELPWVKT